MLKRIVLFLLIGLVLVIAAFYGVGIQYLERRIRSEALAAAQQAQVQLNIGEIHLAASSLNVKSINVFILRAFTSLTIDEIAAHWHLLDLLAGSLSASVDAAIYKGNLNAAIKNSFSNGNLYVNGKLENVDLSQHIQLRSLGITQGSFSVNVADLEISNNMPQSGHGELHIVHLSKPNETRLDLRALGYPLAVVIPAVNALDLDAEFQVINGNLSFRNIEVRSSLGELRGSINMRIMAGFPNGDLRIALSTSGSNAIGPYLPLLSAGRVNQDARNFTISGEFKMGKTRWQTIGNELPKPSESTALEGVPPAVTP